MTSRWMEALALQDLEAGVSGFGFITVIPKRNGRPYRLQYLRSQS